MKLKYLFILMTFIAVISDYLLHPFYPHFFNKRFGVDNPEHVGNYFACICLMAIISFPIWAKISKKIHELKILTITQFIAGILALACYSTHSYLNFWILSMAMILFKGSYLLLYPFTLKIIDSKEHESTIGLLSVVVHLGGILGAIIGGITVDFINAESAFLIMAIGDFIQMGMSIYLRLKKKSEITLPLSSNTIQKENSRTHNWLIFKIGLVTMVLYFSDFLIRPFFSQYWEIISSNQSLIISGIVYAIPGLVALLILWKSSTYPKIISVNKRIITSLSVVIIGLLFQGIPNEFSVLFGRILYGWGIFHATVRFDVLFFEKSTTASYATDYSKVYFMQNLGILLASSLAGILVTSNTQFSLFFVAIIGTSLTLFGFYLFFISPLKPHKEISNSPI